MKQAVVMKQLFISEKLSFYVKYLFFQNIILFRKASIPQGGLRSGLGQSAS
jgi:hypothetical protein